MFENFGAPLPRSGAVRYATDVIYERNVNAHDQLYVFEYTDFLMPMVRTFWDAMG